MDNYDTLSKTWYVDVSFKGKTKTYTIKVPGVLTPIQAKNIAFRVFIEDIKGELAKECEFEMTPFTLIA